MVDNQQDDIVLVDTLKLGAFGGWKNKTLAARTRIGKEAHLEYLAFCSNRCFFGCKANDTESFKMSLVFIQIILNLTLSESFLDKRAIELFEHTSEGYVPRHNPLAGSCKIFTTGYTGTYRVVRAYNHDAAYQERHINQFIVIRQSTWSPEHDSDRVGSERLIR